MKQSLGTPVDSIEPALQIGRVTEQDCWISLPGAKLLDYPDCRSICIEQGNIGKEGLLTRLFQDLKPSVTP
jgi:hypothetical protein